MSALTQSVRDRRAEAKPRRPHRKLAGYLFIAPAILFLAGMVGYPLVWTIGFSFFEQNLRERSTEFVGFANYLRALGDGVFWQGVRTTLIYAFSSVFFHLLVGGGLALLMNERWAGAPVRNFVRGLFIVPWLFSLAAASLMWVLLFQNTGAINSLLLGAGLVERPLDFLGDRNLAIWSLVAVNVWKYFPWFLVLLLGALQGIPSDIYEAAKIDGATRWQSFRFITMPLLWPTIVAVTTLDLVLTYGVFDIVKLMTNGGPFRSTQTAAFYIWQVGLRDVNFGYGSALTVLMLVIAGLLTILFTQTMKGWRR